MTAYRFKQVDVFTARPFLGNPVAVVIGADALDTPAMQAIACWTNLSETTFIVTPTQAGADYRLRIFTPQAELPFAGHPTLGSAHAAIEAGIVQPKDGVLRQECGIGTITLKIEEGTDARLWLRAPEPKLRALERSHFDQLVKALRTGFERAHTPQIVDVGPVWLIVQLADAEAVAALDVDQAAIARLSGATGATGVVAFGAANDGESALHLRAFAPLHGVPEDPVCGSGNISVGAFIAASGLLARFGTAYRARQGMQMGRQGRIAVRIDDDGQTIWLGGDAVTCVEGQLRV